jgi:methionine-rich copper-binding protein CopC
MITAGVASIVSLLTLGVVATPAYAHAKLLRTDPAGGATVTVPVAAVTLTFNQPVKQRSTVVTVSGADGAVYSEGTARVVDANVIQAVRALPAGAAWVSWNTLSADGHPLQGGFGFAVAPSAAPTTAPPTTRPPATTAPADPAGGPSGAGDATPVSRKTSSGWVWPAAAGAVIALALAVGLIWRRRRVDPAPRS